MSALGSPSLIVPGSTSNVSPGFTTLIRKASLEDIPRLKSLIDLSVRALQKDYYTQDQIHRSLERVYGVDTQLITDGTYYIIEVRTAQVPAGVGHAPYDGTEVPILVGCGGWSYRSTLYGGDQFESRDDNQLDPTKDAAKIRAFFVHPEWVRKGLALSLLTACEDAATEAGFQKSEMGSTLSGVPFYTKYGYVESDRSGAPLGDGLVLEIVRMTKDLV